jgi:ATP-dependent Clp protease ATP-binding subunit ClpC
LQKMRVQRGTIRAEIEKIVGTGPTSQTHRTPVCTPRAKKALRIAIQEAKTAGQKRVEPEHIFLGLLREGNGVAAKVLERLGVNVTVAREEILKRQGSRGRG